MRTRSGTAASIRIAGFAVGALIAGSSADAVLSAAVWVVAALTAASGAVVAVRTYETYRRPVPGRPPVG
jgi:hypothetical protein